MLELCCVLHHGAELEHPEALASLSCPGLYEEDGPGVVEKDQQSAESEHDDRHGDRQDAEAQVYESFDRAVARPEEPDRLTRNDDRLEAGSKNTACPRAGGGGGSCVGRRNHGSIFRVSQSGQVLGSPWGHPQSNRDRAGALPLAAPPARHTA